MARQSNQWSAADKVRWLAELARAIDEAQQVVWRLSTFGADTGRASELYGQLEAARDEVERLQRGAAKSVRLELDRDWRELMAIGERVAEAVAQTPCGSSPPPAKGCR